MVSRAALPAGRSAPVDRLAALAAREGDGSLLVRTGDRSGRVAFVDSDGGTLRDLPAQPAGIAARSAAAPAGRGPGRLRPARRGPLGGQIGAGLPRAGFEQTDQAGREVRDDAVDAEVEQRAHLLRLVDGPHVHLHAVAVRVLDQLAA